MRDKKRKAKFACRSLAFENEEKKSRLKLDCSCYDDLHSTSLNLNNNTNSHQLSALLLIGMAAAAAAQQASTAAPVAVTSDAVAVSPSDLAAPELAAEISAQLSALLSAAAAAAPASATSTSKPASKALISDEEIAAVAAMPEAEADAAVAAMFSQAVNAVAMEAAASADAAAAPADAAAAPMDVAAAAVEAAPEAAITAPAADPAATLSSSAAAASRDLDLAAAAATAAASAPAEHTAAALVYQDMLDEVEDLKRQALEAIQADEAAADAAAAAANGAESPLPGSGDSSAATTATVAKYQDKVAKSVTAHSDVLTLLEAKKPEAAAQWDALRESIDEAAEYEKGGPEVFAAASPRLASLLVKAEETEKALQATVEEAKNSGESLNSPEWKAKTVDAVVQALEEAKASSSARAAVAAYDEAMAQASAEGGVLNSFAAKSGNAAAAAAAPVMNEGDLEPIGGGSSLVAPSAGSASSEASPLEMVAVGAREANPARPTVDFLATLPKDVVAGWGADTVTKYLAAVASAAKVPLENVDITAVSTEADAVDTRVTFSSKKDAESWVSKLKEGDDVSGLGAATAAAGLGTATASDVLLVGAGFGAATGEDTVTAAPAPDSSSGVKLSTGAIAGIAVGSAAGVALIAAVVVAVARRRRY